MYHYESSKDDFLKMNLVKGWLSKDESSKKMYHLDFTQGDLL